jgi:hypothetical protein
MFAYVIITITVCLCHNIDCWSPVCVITHSNLKLIHTNFIEIQAHGSRFLERPQNISISLHPCSSSQNFLRAENSWRNTSRVSTEHLLCIQLCHWDIFSASLRYILQCPGSRHLKTKGLFQTVTVAFLDDEKIKACRIFPKGFQVSRDKFLNCGQVHLASSKTG